MTGRRYERKLIRQFDENGWAFVKSPSSGSGRSDDQPDMCVGKATVDMPPMGLEAKTTSDNAYTVPEDEADQLRRWCERFGAVPVVAIYWKGEPGGNVSYGGWYFRGLSEVRRSPVENDAGGRNLRPRRENRHTWAQQNDLNEGRLFAEGTENLAAADPEETPTDD